MKKILFLVSFIMLCASAQAQSLTFGDVLHLFKNHDVATFLKPKGYEKVDVYKKLDYYAIKYKTDEEESVLYQTRGVSYQTYDTKYLESFIKEIKKLYPLMIADESIGFYQFGNTSVNIMVNIHKEPHKVSSISVANR